MSSPSVQYTQTEDGIAIAYVERGTGKPLIVSTGPILPLNVGWEPGGIWDRLSQSFRVIRFDPRGCGLSQRDGEFGSFHDEAVDLAAVVSAVEEPRVAVMGYYIGTPAAVLGLLNEPERYTHLILHLPIPMVGRQSSASTYSSPLSSSYSHREEYTNLLDSTVANLLRLGWKHGEEFARRALLTMLAPSADEVTLRHLTELMRNYPTYERLAQLVPEMRSLDLSKELPTINVPTLVSIPPETGGFDDNHGSFARDWARRIPNARLLVAYDDTPILVDGAATIDQLAEALEEFVGVEIGKQTAGIATRTVLFTDIEGSTSLVDRLGDSVARTITRQIEEVTRQAITEHEGVQIKTMGDGVLAWFGAASAAVSAAIKIQQDIAADDSPNGVQVRIGITTGEPIAEFGDLYGTTVNQAARIMATAKGGEILVSDLVRALMQGHAYQFVDQGEHVLRGFRDPIRLFSIDWQELSPDSS